MPRKRRSDTKINEWQWEMLADYRVIPTKGAVKGIWLTFRGNDCWLLPLLEARILLKSLKKAISTAMSLEPAKRKA